MSKIESFNIRAKIYNKLACQLTSGGVRKKAFGNHFIFYKNPKNENIKKKVYYY